jgi:putative transcriptional regulator
MIIFRIRELIEAKEAKEGRKITLQEVADATGLNRTSLSKMQNIEFKHSTTTAAVESLCVYFDCKVEDVMVYVADDLVTK